MYDLYKLIPFLNENKHLVETKHFERSGWKFLALCRFGN